MVTAEQCPVHGRDLEDTLCLQEWGTLNTHAPTLGLGSFIWRVECALSTSLSPPPAMKTSQSRTHEAVLRCPLSLPLDGRQK